MNVRTRIAPSPTGHPHIGTLFIALFNFIFAKHHQGQFLLRIEDTDRERSRQEFESAILSSLKWAGISWDEGPDVGGFCGLYRQSERTDLYKKACYDLLKAKKAYKCFTSPQELAEMRLINRKMGHKEGYNRQHRNLSDEEIKTFEASKRPYVIRLKVPLSGEVAFQDAIKGRIVTPCADIDDQVLLKSDGFPTYHLANVVDDYMMKISHVIRGDEWISSTPKHILLYKAFHWPIPTFLHMPLLLGLDGKKLSKRRNPTSIDFYKDAGYLPEALCNFLTLMGYSMPKGEEIYSLEDLIQTFDSKRIGTSSALFDTKKLDWINQKYIIHLIPEKDLWPRIRNWGFQDAFMQKLMPLVHTRIKTFGDFFDLCSFFFIRDLPYRKELFCPKGLKPEASAQILQTLIWSLDEDRKWDRESLEKSAKRLSEVFSVNFKQIIIPILFATFMGKLKGPPLFASFAVLGEHLSRARILQAMEFLGGISNKKKEILEKAWEKNHCTDLLSYD